MTVKNGTFDFGASADGIAELRGDFSGTAWSMRFDIAADPASVTNVLLRFRYRDASFNGWYHDFGAPAADAGFSTFSVSFDPSWTDAEATANGWTQEANPAVSWAQTMSEVFYAEIRLRAPGSGAIAHIDNVNLAAAISDVPTATVQATDASASENGLDSGSFTINLDRAVPEGQITVAYSLEGTAAQTADYSLIGRETVGTVTFGPGETSAAVSIAPVADGLLEGNETVVMTVQSGTTYLVGTPSTATVTINDTSVPVLPVTTIQATDPSANEVGPDNGTFTILLDQDAPEGGLAVNYAVSGSADSGDYAPLNGSVTIPAGQRIGTITLTPVSDLLVEGPEQVVLALSAGDGYSVGAASSGAVTIVDTPLPIASFAATAATADEVGPSAGVLNVQLSSPAPVGGVSVGYTVTGSATAGTDYTVLTGSVAISEGQRGGSVTVTPIADDLVDPDETVVLTLTGGTRYVLGTENVATVAIADTPLPVATLEATDPNASETGPGPGVLTVTLDRPAPRGGVSVRYGIGGTATAGQDYGALPGSVDIAAGAVSATISIAPGLDAVVESPPENVIVSLQPGTNYRLGTSLEATVTIADAPLDDLPFLQLPVAGTVKITLKSSNASFSNTLSVTSANANLASSTCTLPGAATGAAGIPLLNGKSSPLECVVELDASASPGLQSFAKDERLDLQLCVQPSGAPCTFRFGSPVLPPRNFDALQLRPIAGRANTFRLGWEDTEGGDNDFNDLVVEVEVIQPTASVTASDERAAEIGGNPGTFTVSLDRAAPTGGLDLAYTLEGTATNGTDYAAPTGPLKIAANETQGTVTLTPIPDPVVEGAETAVLRLAAGAAYRLGEGANATVTIEDTPLPKVSIEAPAATASEAAPGDRSFTLVLDRPAPRDGIQVAYRLGGTAAAGIDYVQLGGVVDLAEGETMAVVPLTALGDKLPEAAETVTVNLQPGEHYTLGAEPDATLSIFDTVPFRADWTVLQIVAGDEFSCALLADGNVKCWGRNASGQLGAGDTQDRGSSPEQMGNGLVPIDLGAGRRAIQLATGGTSACAVLDDHALKCWGGNGRGGLGQGDTNPRGDQPGELGDGLPSVDLGAGRYAVQLAMGAAHTCARLDDGSVKCWGNNQSGQLGLGDNQDRGDQPGEMGGNLAAVSLGAGLKASELAASGDSTCARLNDGSVKCWGKNDLGQLGLGDTRSRGLAASDMGDELPRVALDSESAAVQIAAHQNGFCARLDNGGVKCWGENTAGVLGQGDSFNRGANPGDMGANLPPIPLGTGRTALRLAARGTHVCALLDDGSIKCWGNNASGQLGLGDNQARGDQPGEMGDALPVAGLGTGLKATAVMAGAAHACARLENGRIKCWGSNANGRLGLGAAETANRGDEAGEMGDALPYLDLGAPIPDLLASIQASDASASESGPDSAAFIVSLNRPAPEEGVVVSYRLSGSAVNGEDYAGLSGQLEIAAGTLSASIPVTPVADNRVEGAETVIVDLNFGSNYELGASIQATATLADTPLPVVSVDASDSQGAEAGLDAMTFTLGLDRPAPEGGLQLAYTLAGTASAGADYTAPDGTLAIPEGETGATVTLVPLADTGSEGPETILLTVLPGERHTVGTPGTAVASLVDAPPPISLSLQLSDGDAGEKGPNDGGFRIVLSEAAPAGGLFVPYYLGGTATNQGNNPDYSVAAETIFVPAGATFADLPIAVRPDRLREGTESVVVSLRPSAGYQLGATISAQLGIRDTAARAPSSANCLALQMSQATDLASLLANCQRDNLNPGSTAAYQACKAGAKAAFAEAFENAVRTTEGCEQALAGAEIADNWGDFLGSALDPLMDSWNIVPDTAAGREAARYRRFVTVSRVVERYAKALIRADFREIRSGDRQARQALRQASKTTLLRRMRNLRAGRPDYNGPSGPEFATASQSAVAAIKKQLITPDEPAALKLAAGDGFGCVLLNNSSVKCWGANDRGQLGLGDLESRGDSPGELGGNLAAVPLGLGRRVQDIALGDRHACALLKGGAVKCWGDNAFGQLGLGDTNSRGDQPAEMGDQLPEIDFGGSRRALSIHAGGGHSCARLDDATVKCWGGNQSGQLGLGDTNSRGDQPVEMGEALPAVALGAGRYPVDLSLGAAHTCARFADGVVKCWGQNADGELGLGDTLDRGALPGDMGDALPAVPLALGASIVRAGKGLSCAVLDDGSARCWGRNDAGQLGLGNTASIGTQPGDMGTNLPRIDLGTGRAAEDLMAGSSHVCVRMDDGSLKCWGSNGAGELGLGDTEGRGSRAGQMGDALPAVNLGSFGPAAELALGLNTSCARSEDGAVRCWGSNASGALGLGNIENRGDHPGEMGDALPNIDFGGAAAAAGRVSRSLRQ